MLGPLGSPRRVKAHLPVAGTPTVSNSLLRHRYGHRHRFPAPPVLTRSLFTEPVTSSSFRCLLNFGGMVSTCGRGGFVTGRRSLEGRRRERPGHLAARHPNSSSRGRPSAGDRENGCEGGGSARRGPAGGRAAPRTGGPGGVWGEGARGGWIQRPQGRGAARAAGARHPRFRPAPPFRSSPPVPRGPLAKPSRYPDRDTPPPRRRRDPTTDPAHRAPLRTGPAGNGRYGGGGGESAVPSTASTLRRPRRAPEQSMPGRESRAGKGAESGEEGGAGVRRGAELAGTARGAWGDGTAEGGRPQPGNSGGGGPAASPPGIAPGTRPRQQSRWRRPRVAGARPAASGRPGGVRGCAGCRWAKAAATGIWKVPSRPSPVVPSPPPPLSPPL